MAELPFCPAPNGSLTSRDLGPLQVADLGGHHLHRRPDRGARPQVLGVAVPGDDLGGGHRHQAQGPADVGLDGGVDVGVRPDRARQLADGHGPAGGQDPPAGRGRPAGTTGPAWRRRWSARRGSRGFGPPSACPRTRAPAAAAPRPAWCWPRAAGRRPGSRWRTARCRPRPRRSGRSGSTWPPRRRCAPGRRRRRRPRRGRSPAPARRRRPPGPRPRRGPVAGPRRHRRPGSRRGGPAPRRPGSRPRARSPAGPRR